MLVIMEFLWFFCYLCTGLALDMGGYSLFNAHEFSWNLYEVKAFKEMWYIFTTLFLLLYFGLRVFRSKIIGNALLLGGDGQFICVEDDLAASNQQVASIRELIADATKERKLPIIPVFLIKKSGRVRITSCKPHLFGPPVIVVSSAAINTLNRNEMRWLLAMEMNRLYRGASSLAYKNKAMMVTRTLHFIFIGSFVALWKALTGANHNASTSGAWGKGQSFLSMVFMLFVVSVLLGYAMMALVPLALATTILIVFLCNYISDRRYAAKRLKKYGVDKKEVKAVARKMKALLKSREPAGPHKIDGDSWSRFNLSLITNAFGPITLKNTIKKNRITKGLGYYTRHLSRTAMGCLVAFFVFSTPLFTLYQVAMPWKTVKKYQYRVNTMSWYPTYSTDFSYRGRTGTIKYRFQNIKRMRVQVHLGSKDIFYGIVGLSGWCDQGVAGGPGNNNSIACRASSMFTRFDEQSILSKAETKRLEKTVTKVIKAKLRGKNFAQGQREGIYIYPPLHFGFPFYYLPGFQFIPMDFKDLIMRITNRLETARV